MHEEWLLFIPHQYQQKTGLVLKQSPFEYAIAYLIYVILLSTLLEQKESFLCFHEQFFMR